MNAYRAYVHNQEMVIDFTGEIGTYWQEGRMSFLTDGLTLGELNQKVEEVVSFNKVNKETISNVHIGDYNADEKEPYVAVSTSNNLIDEVTLYSDLETAVRQINVSMYQNFDREVDDARIFNAKGEEVYSFPDETASLCDDYNFTEEEYVDFAMKLWKGEIQADEDNIKNTIMEYEETLIR